MTEKRGPAFDVSKVSESDRFGGTTYALKAHFHTRDHAETVRRLLLEECLPPGPFPAQFADQAESIDLDKLEKALVWYGCSTPVREMLGWWVGREVNRLLDAVLTEKVSRYAADHGLTVTPPYTGAADVRVDRHCPDGETQGAPL